MPSVFLSVVNRCPQQPGVIVVNQRENSPTMKKRTISKLKSIFGSKKGEYCFTVTYGLFTKHTGTV